MKRKLMVGGISVVVLLIVWGSFTMLDYSEKTNEIDTVEVGNEEAINNKEEATDKVGDVSELEEDVDADAEAEEESEADTEADTEDEVAKSDDDFSESSSDDNQSLVDEDFDQKDYMFDISSSSTLIENVSGESRVYSVKNLFDDNNTTIWAEGESNDCSQSWLEFTSTKTFNLDTISITNGFAKNSTLYFKNNRFVKATITSNTGESMTFEMEDGVLDLVEIEVGFKGVKSFRIQFDEVLRGSRYNDLCISEFRLNGAILENIDVLD